MNVTAVLITREPEWPVKLGHRFDQTLVCTDCPNVVKRFELAALAGNPHVYVQDDDIELDIARLAAQYDGRTLTNVMPVGMQQVYADKPFTLVGYGCFFPRQFAEWFVHSVEGWRKEFGQELVDIEADRFFTYEFQPWKHVDMTFRQRVRPGLCSRPDHYRVRDMIARRLKERV